MSGHSKWNNIAKRKGANDAKKAKIFTKIGREMAIAIKEGGSTLVPAAAGAADLPAVRTAPIPKSSANR